MKFTKFGTKLFGLFLLVSILPLGIAGTIVYKYVYDRTKTEVSNQLITNVNNYYDKLHLLLTKKKYRVIDFSSDGFISDCVYQMSLSPPEYFQIREHLNNHLTANKKSIDPDILEIEILNDKGEVIASTSQKQIGKNESHEIYFRNPFLLHEQKGSFFADTIKREDGADELQLVFSGMLTDRILHKPLGVLVIKVKGSILRDIFGTQNHKNDKESSGDHRGEVYIVNADRVMIASSNPSNKINHLSQRIDTKCICKVLASKENTFGIYENYRAALVLGSAMYVPGANWVIVSEENVTDAFLPLTRIKHIFIISGGGAFVLVLIFAFFISHNINAIIRKLIDGTRRVAKGDLENPIVIGKRNDEIGELGESFNLMIQELGKTTGENKRLFFQVKRGRDEWLKTFDAITDIITIYDKNFEVVRANKAFFEKFKINTGPLSDEQFYEITSGIDSPWDKNLLVESIKSLRPESEEVYDSKMGGVFLMTAYPLIDGDGEVFGIVHLAKDITSQKNVERQLIEKANELETANRELEGFVYIVSHDLKEPLFAIEGYASRLSMDYKDRLDRKGKHRIERIRVNTQKMSQKINEIMEVLKVGRVSYNFKNNNVEEIVHNVVDLLGSRIKASRISVSIKDVLPTAFCDRERLSDVFTNLITNAIKFMDGEIKKIIIGYDHEGNYYKFFVEDTGIGIRGEYNEQIFKIFRRLDDVDVEGTGVGLAIVKKIVEMHSGKVWVESPVNEGKGSRFCFTLPIKRERIEMY
ncbi:MAG: HAMP domain-containing protein [Candidatus Brocadiaceae bacterium]|nr:HAMP domain-containing protein [Candidatus Brocadiaceae bacterium]